jgi:P pilus assembly chaperone PapD
LWHREGNDLVVNNPTPFYMNFQSVTLTVIRSIKRPGPYKNRNHFALPAHTGGSTVSWSIITDYGSISKTLSASVH